MHLPTFLMKIFQPAPLCITLPHLASVFAPTTIRQPKKHARNDSIEKCSRTFEIGPNMYSHTPPDFTLRPVMSASCEHYKVGYAIWRRWSVKGRRSSSSWKPPRLPVLHLGWRELAITRRSRPFVWPIVRARVLILRVRALATRRKIVVSSLGQLTLFLFFFSFFNPFAKGSWKWTINDGPQGENEYRLRTVALPSFLQDKMTFLTLRDIPRVRLATLIDSLYVIEIFFRRRLKSYTVKLIGSHCRVFYVKITTDES